jgi:hypothetical protein
VWEDGVKKDDLGLYQTGSSVMISREAGYVKYYVNDVYKLTSSKTTAGTLNTAMLYADATIYDNGGTIKGVDISFSTEKTILDNLGFRYAYDRHKRMVYKQVPGMAPVYMVYDNHNRLVLTQDGNQRTGKHWAFTKYDMLNRPVLTGITTADSVLTQAKMQARVDSYYNKLATNAGAWFEKYVGNIANSVHGYTNLSYPLSSDEQNYLSATYYDTYSQPATEQLSVVGQITGTKIKVLDENIAGTISGGYTWLKSINYFDDKYRLVQSLSDNYKGGIDRMTSIFDFTGKVQKLKSTHVNPSVTWNKIVGAKIEGNKLIRTAGSVNWGTSGASSVEILSANTNGWIEVVASETTSNRMIGFADTDPDQNFTQIDYALYLTNATSLVRIYENGQVQVTPGTYKPGDVFKIERTGTTVKYYQNNNLIHTSTKASSTVLMADASFNGPGASLMNVRSSFSVQQHEVIRTFEYDHAGRMTKLWHQLDGGTNYLLAKSEYNELGQLIDKKLHSTDPLATTARQSVDMRYNIRGWITSINNSTLSNNATNNDSNDLFGMNLAYNETIAGLNNTSLYNGNIGAIKWSKNIGLSAVKEQAYNYSYDAMGRLSSASHKHSSTP